MQDHPIAFHVVSVTGIVVREDGRLLAIKRADNGTWVPPGGILELDEGLHQGIAREVLEETGVVVRPERLTGVYKNIDRETVTITFLCSVVGGEARASDEASEVTWMTPNEARAKMPPIRAIRVTDAFAENGPFVRSYHENEWA